MRQRPRWLHPNQKECFWLCLDVGKQYSQHVLQGTSCDRTQLRKSGALWGLVSAASKTPGLQSILLDWGWKFNAHMWMDETAGIAIGRGTGRMASSSSYFWRRSQWSSRELSRLGPSIRPHDELLLPLMQKKPTLVPDSEAFNSCIGEGFLIPELKDGSEASKDEQAARVETTWVVARCFSSGYLELATQLPSSYKTGRWQR